MQQPTIIPGNLGADFRVVDSNRYLNDNYATGSGAPTANPVEVGKTWLWIDEGTNQITHYWDVAGAAWVPFSSAQSRQLLATCYDVKAGVTATAEYAAGDELIKIFVLDTAATQIEGTLWINITQGPVLTADPTQSDIEVCGSDDELLETKQCVYNCDAGVIVELREVVVTVNGLIQGHDATAYSASDFSGFTGDGSGNVRSYYQQLDGTNIADADRPASVSCDPTCGREKGCITEPDGSTEAGYQICSVESVQQIPTIEASSLDLTDTSYVAQWSGTAVNQVVPANGTNYQSWVLEDGTTLPDGSISDAEFEIISVDEGDGDPYSIWTGSLAILEGQNIRFQVPNNGNTAGYNSFTVEYCPNSPPIASGCGDVIHSFTISDLDIRESFRLFPPTNGYLGYSVPSDSVTNITPEPGGSVLFEGTINGASLPSQNVTILMVGVDCMTIELINNEIRAMGGPGGNKGFAFTSTTSTGDISWITSNPPAEIQVGCPVGPPIDTVVCRNFEAIGTENTTGTFACGCCPAPVALVSGDYIELAAGESWIPADDNATAFAITESTGTANTITTPTGSKVFTGAKNFGGLNFAGWQVTAGPSGRVEIQWEAS